MASGSLSVLQKNVMNSASGFIKFGVATGQAFTTYKKIKDRIWNYAPTSVREQKEVWEDCYWKRNICQQQNMWVDKELHTEVSQKEVAQFLNYKMDLWRVGHWGITLPIFGAWALPFWIFWFGNDSFIPSTFNSTPEQVREWRKAQDLYRYKYAPAIIHDTKWFPEFHARVSEEYATAWDELFEKNDVHRCPQNAHKIANHYNKMIPFFRCRRKQLRGIGRAMNIPTFPLWKQINLQTRIAEVWGLLWNEDYMVVTQGLHEKMTDEELYDYAWRRLLAPYDKNLTREQLMQRVTDYHTFLGKPFVESGTTPNLFVTVAYCAGYYNEPAFLEGDISELDGDDFTSMASIGKDAFLRRLEFENGPLRDQVEAHSIKKMAERQKLLQQS